MYRVEKVKLKNFQSHIDSVFEFEQGVATVVSGINLSDEGAVSNGSGKSAVLEAITFALTNSSIRFTSTKDLINDNCDSAEVELFLFNDILNEKVVIKRIIYTNSKSSELEILINNQPPKKDLSSVSDGDKFILEDLLNISREDLLNYFLISKEKYISFFKASDTKKRAIIARFSQADLIDPCFIDLDTDINKKEKEVSELMNQSLVIQGKIDTYKEEIDSIDLKEIESQVEEEVNSLKDFIIVNKDKIDTLASLSTDLELDIKLLKDGIETINNNIKQKEVLSKSFLEKEKVIQEKIKTIDIELRELNDFETELIKGISSAVKCPACSREFSIANDKLNIDKVRERIKLVKEEIILVDKLKEDQYNLKKTLTEKQDKVKKDISNLENELRTFKSELNRVEIKKKSHLTEIEEIENKNKKIAEEIEKILEENINEAVERLKEKLDENELIHENLIKSIEKKTEEKAEVIELKEIFIKFKTHLSNKAILTIEKIANEHLESTKTNLSVQLDGYKIKRDGKIKEDITATVLKDGSYFGTFSKLSGGEKAKIEIAIIMSLQRLINNSVEFGRGLELTWLDEITESLDKLGIEGIVHSLNNLDKTVVIITHGIFDKVYPHQSLIVKESFISKIYNDKESQQTYIHLL